VYHLTLFYVYVLFYFWCFFTLHLCEKSMMMISDRSSVIVWELSGATWL